MKKVLANIVLFLLANVLFAIIEIVPKLVILVLARISVGKVLFWVIVFGGGCGLLSVMLWVAIVGEEAIVALAEKIAPAKSGARYFVWGTIFVIWYVWQIVRFCGITSGIRLAVQIVSAVVCIISSIVIFTHGYSAGAKA